jgi:hypothetical protein
MLDKFGINPWELLDVDTKEGIYAALLGQYGNGMGDMLQKIYGVTEEELDKARKIWNDGIEKFYNGNPELMIQKPSDGAGMAEQLGEELEEDLQSGVEVPVDVYLTPAWKLTHPINLTELLDDSWMKEAEELREEQESGQTESSVELVLSIPENLQELIREGRQGSSAGGGMAAQMHGMPLIAFAGFSDVGHGPYPYGNVEQPNANLQEPGTILSGDGGSVATESTMQSMSDTVNAGLEQMIVLLTSLQSYASGIADSTAETARKDYQPVIKPSSSLGRVVVRAMEMYGETV